MVVTVVTILILTVINGVASNPQGQFVSQNVDDSVDYQQQQHGRSGDQWWKNYEVIEEHVDDLDDQLEMLYMYSVNPLELSAITTSPKTISSNRHIPVQSVGTTFDSRQTKPVSRGSSTFVSSTSTTTLPPPPPPPPRTTLPPPPPPPPPQTTLLPPPPPPAPRTTATSLPYQTHSKPFSTIPNAIPILSDQQANIQPPVPPLDRLQPQSPRNRVRVIVKRPSSGQKVNAPIKDSDGAIPQKLPLLNSVAAPKKAFDSTPIAAESDPIPRTISSSDSPIRNPQQSEQTDLTAETYRNTDTTPNPFLASATTSIGQLPRYSKLLNRYSLLDTVNRDLNSASSEHRDDHTVALEDVQKKLQSLRHTRNDVVQPPSARSFRSNLEQEEESFVSTEVPITSSKRSRRRRPKTSPVPPSSSSEWTEQTRSVDWDIGSTDVPSDWEEGRVSRTRPTHALRTTITTTAFLETTLPPIDEIVPLVKHVPESRGIISGSRRRTPSTSSPATIGLSSTSIQSGARQDRHGRTHSTHTTPPLATDGRSAATYSSTVSESLRTTTHPTTVGVADGSNDVLGATSRTSSPFSRHLRQRTQTTQPLATDGRGAASYSPSTFSETLRTTTHPTSFGVADGSNDVLGTTSRTSSPLSRHLRQRTQTTPFLATDGRGAASYSPSTVSETLRTTTHPTTIGVADGSNDVPGATSRTSSPLSRHLRQRTQTTPTLATDGHSAAAYSSSTVSESLRTTTHATTVGVADGSNDVLGTTSRTSSPLSRHLRPRTAPFTGTTKKTTEVTTEATTVASKSKETNKFKPRGTVVPRRGTSFTTTTTTIQPIVNNTEEQKPTQRTPFSNSRFRFRPSSSSTTVSSGPSSSSSSTESTSTIGPVSSNSTDAGVTPASHNEESRSRKFKPRRTFLHSQQTTKAGTTETSTAPTTTTSPATTDGTILETTAKISPFAKKFRPRPTGSRFQTSSTTESTQPLTPIVSETISDITNSSSSTTLGTTTRSLFRNPLKAKGTPPLTRLSTGPTPAFVASTTPLTPSSTQNIAELETVSGQEIESTEFATTVPGVIGGKRRRRPIGTKKPVPSTPLLITDSTESVSPTGAVSTVGFTRKLTTTTTAPLVIADESTSELTTTVPQRRKFRRRKITQRSTLSGAEEHGALNGTTVSKSDISWATSLASSTSTITAATSTTTAATTITTTTAATTTKPSPSTVTESWKPTTEASKKTLFGIKAKKNETDVKSGKEHGSSVPLLSLEGGDIVNLQADESGDSVWFSSSGSNVQIPDDVLAQGNRQRGSSHLLSVHDSAAGPIPWFGASSDESSLKGADSSPENVKVEGEGSIDTRPLLISRISDDLDTESHGTADDEHIVPEEAEAVAETEAEVKPSKEVSQTRSATFSVSSSTSVHDGETSKSSSSKSEPSIDTSKDAEDDDDTDTKTESDSNNSKFIIIDKTALRGNDEHKSDSDEPTETTNNEQDEKKGTSESADDHEEEKVKEIDSTTRTTAKVSTTTDDSRQEEDRKRNEDDESPVTTSKSRGRGNSKDDDTTSSRTTTTTSKSSSDRESTSRSGSRSRSSSSSRRQQSSTSTIPTSTTEVVSTTTETPEDEKPPSDTAVSYFGEDEETPSDHGALDDINGEGVEGGAVESSYDHEPPIEESEGGHDGQVSAADTVFEHSDPNEDSSHKTESVPVSEDESSIASGDRWDLSALSEFSGPIRSSSSINVEVLSRAPKLIQLAARREEKSSRSGVDSEDGEKTRSRQSLRNILKTVGVETMPSSLESSTETSSDNSTKESPVISTTKRDVSSVSKFAYLLPSIKTAADIAELFDAITSPPSGEALVQPFQPPSKAAILKINSTMTTNNSNNNTAAVTSKSMEDAGTLTLQSLTGPANCSKAERNICPKSEDYPKEVVDFVIKSHEETLNKLWEEIKADRINARLFAEEPERKKEELSVCDSSIEDLQPGWAKDAATGKWMIILNTPQYPQVLRIESCQRPQRECLFISPYYKSTCVEHYSVHRLVAIRSDDPTSGPVVGIFKFPCGCSCKVEMFHGQNH